MSFFNWFTSKPREFKTNALAGSGSDNPKAMQTPPVSAPAERPAPTSVQTVEDRRLRRHARREQLYVAVRESMIRSGVLSASYKFKVLSLDQIGNEFLVMVDLSMAFDSITGQLGAMESLIARQAKARFDITVPTVYWRMDTATGRVSEPAAPAAQAVKPLTLQVPAAATVTVAATTAVAAAPAPSTRPPIPGGAVPMRRDPIEADEVAAFRHALLAASAKGHFAHPENNMKTRTGPHSYTLLTGFEDTELPESNATPALSKTQYGELN